MTKFNVGDKVRVLNKREILGGGHLVDGYTYRVEGLFGGHPVIRGRVIVSSEYHAIELVGKKDSATDRRLTEAEAKIATLEAEVKALKDADCCRRTEAPSIDEMTRLGKSVTRTPNQRRYDVIKRAQAFANEGYDRWFGDSLCYVEFFVNSDKRTVVAVLRGKYSCGLITKGIAKCAPDDVFNADIGKAIALGRALGVKVPKEFTDAVKPTEVVVGMRIRMQYAGSKSYYERSIESFEGGRVRYDSGSFDMRSSVCEEAIILDDTNAVYL